MKLILILIMSVPYAFASLSLDLSMGLIDEHHSQSSNAQQTLPAGKASGGLSLGIGVSTDPRTFIGLYLAGELNFLGGRVQYNYKESENASAITNDDTKVSYVDYRALFGLRFNLIDHLFFGGGVMGGKMSISVQLDDVQTIQNKNGPTSESHNIYGPYAEAGIGFLSKDVGAALMARYLQFKTDSFKIMNDNRYQSAERSVRITIFVGY